MRRTVIVALIMVTLFAIGCGKDGIDNSDVSFTNRLDKTVTLDIYSSKDLYAKGEQPTLRKVMLAKETTYLPGNTFTAGRVYYMDWYTDDFYNNNWYNDDYGTAKVTRIQPVPGNNNYYLDPRLQGNARKTFLSNTAASTRWVAVGAYLFAAGAYTDQWSSLSTNERYREVIIEKGFKSTHNTKDANGTVQTSIYEFMVHESNDAYIEFKDGAGNNAGNMTGGKLPSGSAPDFKVNSSDSVMALLPGSQYLFLMAKQ